MSDLRSDLNSPIVVYTPFQCVWGKCQDGDFWWCLEVSRFVLRRPGSPAFELYEGDVCQEHGLEGDLVGHAGSYEQAFQYLLRGGVAPAGMVH